MEDVWQCPKCGTTLAKPDYWKKDPALFLSAQAGLATGWVNCGACGAGFSLKEVAAGTYDVGRAGPKRSGRRLAIAACLGALGLVLVALCVVFGPRVIGLVTGRSGPYRDPQVELATAKTALKARGGRPRRDDSSSVTVELVAEPGADGKAPTLPEREPPTGDLCILNVRRDGSVWVGRAGRVGSPTSQAELPGLIVTARRLEQCLALRCDRRAQWGSVVPLLEMLVKAKVMRIWFCVENQGEAFLDYAFPVATGSMDSELRTELWVSIKRSGPGGDTDTAQVFVDQKPMKDWDELANVLRRHAAIPHAVHDPVIISPKADVHFEWFIRAFDCLREAGFHDIWIAAAGYDGGGLVGVPPIPPEPPEPPDVGEIGEDLNVPIEDIPITPESTRRKDGADPGPDTGLDTTEDIMKDVERPVEGDEPPSSTPVFRVDSATGKATGRGIYSARRNFGTGKVPGGRGGTNAHATSAVMAGLIWLAKAQENDGHWDCKRWEGGDDHDVGMTSLALLAFLGAGYTHTKGKFKTTVEKGLDWLARNQKDNGSFGWKTFDEQGIATVAVSEAYGLTQSPAVGRMAQRAVDYICKEQPDHGGFGPQGPVANDEGDTAVAGWQIMAIKSAICSELKVPPEAVDRARVFLKNSLRENGGSARTVGDKDAAPTTTAIGMLCRQFLGGDYDAEILAAADWLRKHQGGKPGVANATKDNLVGDLHYTYYSVLAMFQMGGEWWPEWNKLFRDPLAKCQVHEINDARGRFVRGSWDPQNHVWAKQSGGRVYATAMAVLSLEVYYRFLPVYKK
ncbi:MAG: hypothetical protein FJ290_23255 [Planctomycetes bacterium]|nr:hypothetical protein [Planctomycetota bacterium]